LVSFYNLIDVLFLILISFGSIYSFKKKIYLKFFEYIKIFFIITVSAKFASSMGILLEKIHTINADTYTTLILIGFSINIFLLFYFWYYLFTVINKFIKSNTIKIFIAKLFTFLEVLIVVTFTNYIFMQLSLSKIYLSKSMAKSYTYPYIQKFYKNFLNDDFKNMLLNSDTSTNHKEIILKSLKNSL
jgi:hypothetical protein